MYTYSYVHIHTDLYVHRNTSHVYCIYVCLYIMTVILVIHTFMLKVISSSSRRFLALCPRILHRRHPRPNPRWISVSSSIFRPTKKKKKKDLLLVDVHIQTYIHTYIHSCIHFGKGYLDTTKRTQVHIYT